MTMQRRMRVVDDGDGTMATTLKVAFATSDMKQVNQHFGSAQGFAIYAVNPDNAYLLEANEFGRLAQDGNEDKLVAKIQVLEGCAAVYSQAIGSSAVQKLLQAGVQPVKVSEGRDIAELIQDLQDEMRAGPSAWVAKAIARQQGPDMSRFDDMEAEGWEE